MPSPTETKMLPRPVLARTRLARATSAVALAIAVLASAPASRADGIVPPPAELPAKLSLDDALATFHAHGFQILIAEAAVMSAEGDERIAGAVPNPSLSLGYGRAFGYSVTQAGESPDQYSIGLSDSAAIED